MSVIGNALQSRKNYSIGLYGWRILLRQRLPRPLIRVSFVFVDRFDRLSRVFADIPCEAERLDEVNADKADNWKKYLPGGKLWQQLTTAGVVEFAMLIGFTTFFLGYGLVPYLGGSVIGLVAQMNRATPGYGAGNAGAPRFYYPGALR